MERFSLNASLLDSGGSPEPDDKRIFGVCPAMIISNADLLAQGRVQIQVPWLPGQFLFARVAVPMAGMMRGTFFIPQVGDEVLVAFAQGDTREAYVIGSLWNTLDRLPPNASTPMIDPVVKRIIRTPLGNELEFDEKLQSITLRNILQHTVTLDPTGITLATVGNTASIKLGIEGDITITAVKSISIASPQVAVTGTSNASFTGGSVSLGFGADCTILAGTVNIN
jgi:phage baseplate assembly protein gpV